MNTKCNPPRSGTGSTVPAVALAPELESIENDFPAPGEYWRSLSPISYGYADSAETIPAGVRFLVTDVAIIEGDFHSAVLFVPPPYGLGVKEIRNRQNELKYTADRFFDKFARCETDVAEIVREKQAELSGAMESFGSQLNRQNQEIERLAAPAVAARTGGESGDLPVKAETLPAILEFETGLAAQTKRAHALVHVTAMEIQAQMSAAMHKPKQMLEKLNGVVARIAAYSGEDVKIEQLTDGPRTTEPQPLTVFQSMRYMDEELLVSIAEGGADHRDWRRFVTDLADDERLLNRILPAEHGLCLMRYRREAKKYARGNSVSAFWTNFTENQGNLYGFLLYRDGRTLWRIDSPITEHQVPSLFPTAEQLDEPFKPSWPSRKKAGERVRFGDLEYRESWAKHEKIAFAYKILLLVLWGLRDREQFFPWMGNAPMAKLIRDPAAFRWVHDDENLLGDGRAGIFDWLGRNQVDYLESGVRVLCNWRALLTKEVAPAYHRGWGNRVDGPAVSVCVARREGGEYYVECPLADGRNIKVMFSRWLRDFEVQGKHGTGAVVIDAVRLADVDRYIESREARQHYVHFIDSLLVLRDILRKDRDEQADVRAAIASRHPGVDIEDAFFNAVRTWRASRRGRQLPRLADGAFGKVVAAIDASIKATLRDGDGTALLERMPEGDDTVAIARTGRGRYVSYVVEPDGERPLVPQLFHRRKQWIRRADGSLRLERQSLERYTHPLPASETIVWEDEAKRPDHKDLPWLRTLTPRQFEKIEAICEADAYVKLLDGDLPVELRDDLLEQFGRERLDYRATAVLVLGSAYLQREARYGGDGEDWRLYTAESRLLPMLWRLVGADERSEFRRSPKWWRRNVHHMATGYRNHMTTTAWAYAARPTAGQVSQIRFYGGLPVAQGGALSRDSFARRRGGNGGGAETISTRLKRGIGSYKSFAECAQAYVNARYAEDYRGVLPDEHLRSLGWGAFVKRIGDGLKVE